MNKTVVITGASRGLGLSLAKLFLERGERVIGISRTRNHWEEARSNIPDDNNLSFFAFDVTDEEAVKRLVRETVNNEATIDILINNAGYAAPDLLTVDEESIENIREHFKQNLETAFLMSKHVIPVMRKQNSGLIVNVSSMAGLRSVPKLFSYSTSKFGVVALSQCIAKENAEFGIKSFSVCPGGINTKMRSDIFGKEDAERQQSPDYVANVIMDCIDEKVHVDSGGDIAIRHGEISAINPVPGV